MALGWAVIGTGWHVDHKIAPAIHATPDAELVATYSRDQGRADACAQKHGAKAAYSDLGALLRDSRVDAVFIASPNALHAQHALQAAQAGKHILSEKPMTTTLDDAVAMVRTCRARGVKLGVGYHLRQHPGLREARRLVAEGVLGTVALAQGQWGFGVRGQDTPRPLEQLLAMALRFDRGTIATVCCGRRLPDSRNDLVLYGSRGRLLGSDALWEGRQGTFDVVSETMHTTDTYPPQPLANFIDELDDFHRAIVESREPAATGLDGLRVVQVTLAMIASARDQRTIRIEPLTV